MLLGRGREIKTKVGEGKGVAGYKRSDRLNGKGGLLALGKEVYARREKGKITKGYPKKEKKASYY